MRVTVCGAGPAGLGMAACLMSCGHEATLYDIPAFAEKLVPFQKNPELVSCGRLDFAGRLRGAASDVSEALTGAEVIFVVMHAAAHRQLGAMFAPYIRGDQLIVMCPGYVGGGLELTRALEAAGAAEIPPYIETSSLPITGMMDGAKVRIKAWKRNFVVYCPDVLRSHEIISWFEKMYAPLKFAASPLEPGLNEINIVVHAVVTLLNVGRIERGEPWLFYRTGLTPSIARVIEAIHAERVELENALGPKPRRLSDMLHEFYGDQGMARPEDGLYEQLRTFEPFAAVGGPLSLNHRFLSEDLRYGLVPMVWLGRQKGVPMPMTRAVVRLASAFTGHDELNMGRRIML